MKSFVLVVRALLFFLLGIALWFAGTLFHVSLWWSLGIPKIPPILPFANLLIMPLCFWLSWQLTLHPHGLACTHCREERGETEPRRRAQSSSTSATITASASE